MNTQINDVRITREIEVNIGRKLREKRLKRGFTLSTVAEKFGISHQQVQKYEQAQSRVSAAALYKFSLLYDVEISQFFESIDGKLYEDACKSNNVINTRANNKLKILLVEDDPGDEAITRKVLDSLDNVQILCIHDGMQALEVLRYKTLCSDFSRPDIILLDLRLPKIDGLAVLKDIKRDSEIQNIPIIALTNNLSTEIMQQAYRGGVSGFICKSFNFEKFKQSLLDCINYWQTAVVLPNKE